MGENKYVLDQLTFSIRKAGVNVGRIVWKIVSVLLASVSMIVVAYALFALCFSTDTERRLKRENRMYEQVYPMLQPKQDLLTDAIASLQARDNSVYETIFHTQAPNPDPVGALSQISGADTIPDAKMVAYTARKSDALVSACDSVEAAFSRIFRTVADSSFIAPPLDLPVKGISYSQIGASEGRKLNLFYKTYIHHSGLDIIAPQGSPVYAAADGTVTEVRKSVKGEGNKVTIAHKGGCSTAYSHLLEMDVKTGQKVTRGQKIGSVGMTGSSYSPHLHYEVLRGGEHLDPVTFLFASISPDEYANMLYMAVNTLQSMD